MSDKLRLQRMLAELVQHVRSVQDRINDLGTEHESYEAVSQAFGNVAQAADMGSAMADSLGDTLCICGQCNVKPSRVLTGKRCDVIGPCSDESCNTCWRDEVIAPRLYIVKGGMA